MGFIVLNKQKKQKIKFRNLGKQSTNIIIESNNKKTLISFIPQQFILQAYQQKEVIVIIRGGVQGQYKGFVDIRIGKQIKNIFIQAIIIQESKYVIDSFGQNCLSSNFGLLLNYQKKQLRSILVNNSSQRCAFKILLKQGQFDPNKITSRETQKVVGTSVIRQKNMMQILKIEPSTGIIEPFDQFQIKLQFTPIINQEQRQLFEKYIKLDKEKRTQLEQKILKIHKFTAFISMQNQQLQVFYVQAQTIIPKLALSKLEFNFGDCNCYSHKQYLAQLSNDSDIFSHTIKFQKNSMFKMSPSQFQLVPNSTKSIIISFQPKYIGIFVKTLFLSVDTGQFKIPINVKGNGINFQRHRHLARSIESQLNDFIKMNDFINTNQHLSSQKEIKKIQFSSVINENRKKKMICKEKKQKKLQQSTIQLKEDEKPLEQLFQSTMYNCPKPTKIQIIKENYPLFVTKPIFNRMPIGDCLKKFEPKIGKQYKQFNPGKPPSYQLTPQLLRLIQIYPKQIDFGNTYPYNKLQKVIYVKNECGHPINFRLQFMLQNIVKTSHPQMLIPSGSIAGFQINLMSTNIEDIQTIGEYTINYKQKQQFVIKAKIEQIQLYFSSDELKFAFADDENMISEQFLTITNQGNGTIEFEILGQSQIFIFSQYKVELKSNSKINIKVIYHPSKLNMLNAGQHPRETGSKTQVQIFDINIKHGENKKLKCIGYRPQSKCMVKQKELNMGSKLINMTVTNSFQIKNLSKSACYLVLTGPKEIKLSQNKFRMVGNQSRKIKVQFSYMKVVKFDSIIKIEIKGGQAIILPIKGQVIFPRIQILEKEFNFGETSYSHQATHPMTIKVDTDLQLVIIINISQKVQIISQSRDQSIISLPIESDLETHIQLVIKSRGIHSFILKFIPTQEIKYCFPVKFILDKYGQIQNLRRIVTCIGKKALLVVQPKVLKFPTKIINCFKTVTPVSTNAILYNPEISMIKWQIKEESLRLSKYFSCFITQGIIDPITKVSLTFNYLPKQYGTHFFQLPIYVNNYQYPQEYIKLIGQCRQPQIHLSKKEIIMPTVPLKIKSQSQFKLINQGFQNFIIKHRFEQQLPEGMKLQFICLDHNKLNILIKQATIKLTFYSEIPISFANILVIQNQAVKKEFKISVSGIASNSVLINQDYFIRNQKKLSYNNKYMIEDEIQNVGNIEDNKEFIRCWLNHFYLSEKKINQFPQQMNEQIVPMLFQHLNLTGLTHQRSINSLNYFQTLINKLKQKGLFLNNIRPYFLLGQKEFKNYIKQQSIDKEFKIASYQGWSTLIYALFEKQYRVHQKKANQYYSTQQLTVLKWLSQTLCEQINNFIEMKSSLRLYNLLKAYLPITDEINLTQQITLKRFFQLSKQYRFQLGIKKQHFKNATNRQMYILMNKLFNVLPHFLPRKEKVIFEGILHQTITKFIQVQNPSFKSVQFEIKIFGSSDFNLKQKFFTINSKSTYKLNISFNNRLSISKTGKLYLIPLQINLSPLVFLLQSITKQSKSQRIYKVETVLYKSKQFSIEIFNRFIQYQYADFDVKIIMKQRPFLTKNQSDWKIYQQKLKQLRKNYFLMKKPLKQPLKIKNQQYPTPFPMFFCKTYKIKIKRNSQYQLYMEFLPLTLQTHVCYVILIDNQVGQMKYQVHGSALQPEIQEEPLMLDLDLGIPFVFEYELPVVNKDMQKARKQSKQYLKSTKIDVENLNFPGQISYSLKCMNINSQQFVSIPQEIKIPSNVQKFKMPINLLFDRIYKNYLIDLLLINVQLTDARRILISVNVRTQKKQIELFFKGWPRQIQVQNIPIVNNNDRDLQFKLYFTKSHKYFSIKHKNNQIKEIKVKKKSTLQTQLVFKPSKPCQIQAILLIQNLIFNDIYEYLIKANCQYPLAQKNYNLEAQLKVTTHLNIEVYNKDDAKITYLIETDLPFCSGPKQIIVNGKSTGIYKLAVTPIYSIDIIGSVSFIEKDNPQNLIWVTINLHTPKPKFIRTFSTVATIRQPITIEIIVQNNQQQDVLFKVNYNAQDQEILGQDQFLAKVGLSKYELVWIPLKVRKVSGSIGFVNKKVGQKWYALQLQSVQTEIRRLPQVRCQIGKQKKIQLTLENPSKNKANISIFLSNENIFRIENKNYELQAEKVTPIFIVYRPCRVNIEDRCQVDIKCQMIGDWKFIIFGKGYYPTEFQPLIIYGNQFTEKKQIVKFKNPMNKKTEIEIELVSNDPQAIECLKIFYPLTKYLLLKENQQIQIMISFLPKEIRSYKAELKLSMIGKVDWIYPIYAYGQKQCQGIAHHFKTTARIPIRQHFYLIIQNLQSSQMRFNFQLIFQNEKDQKLAEQFLKLECMTSTIKKQKPLHFIGQFFPMKPFKIMFDIVIKHQLEGSYRYFLIHRYKILLQSFDPQIDQIIILKAIPSIESSVIFKFHSRQIQTTAFKAYITDIQSSQFKNPHSQFKIKPQGGIMAPYKSKIPTEFRIYFTPKQNFKNKSCKLIVETQSMYWSFIVKAMFAKYNPPVGQFSLLSIRSSKKNVSVKPK